MPPFNFKDMGERKQYSFGDYEEVSQKICEFQRKMDELGRKIDGVKIEVANAKVIAINI